MMSARVAPGHPEIDGLDIARRIAGLSWSTLAGEMAERGYATTGPLMTERECEQLVALYAEPDRFRKRVIMQRHNYGHGEYQYFDYPLPPAVQAMRVAFYPKLALIANDWHRKLKLGGRFPADLTDYLKRCHAAGQARPTPLMLKYGEGDYNRLHQDLYGEFVFPIQVAILLSAPSRDFIGGEFVLVEQRPRTQSRAEVVSLAQGEAVMFAVNHRAEQGPRGYRRVALRHGVSRLRSGSRFCLGIIFHDAA